MTILIILTCYNRKEKTEQCIKSIVNRKNFLDFTFIIVDDLSTDGTIDMLETLKDDYNVHIIVSDGNLFYSGGMRKGMSYALEKIQSNYDYILMINDDVLFFDQAIDKLVKKSIENQDAVVVGATCDYERNLTYGAIKYRDEKTIKYNTIGIEDRFIECDTFNANCVLIPSLIFRNIGVIDKHYIHSLGDLDYGLRISRSGYKIYTSNEYVGYCMKNLSENTWNDRKLNIIERIKLKESIKGAPLKPWFYFLKKNFSIRVALVKSITPFVKIIFNL